MAGLLFTPSAIILGSADNNGTIALTLGTTTFVEVTLTSSISIVGIAADGGNVDGSVACFNNITSGGAFILSFLHDSGIPAFANRFRTGGEVPMSVAPFGAAWFRYSALTQCWQQMMRA